jgi:hypothetical protein
MQARSLWWRESSVERGQFGVSASQPGVSEEATRVNEIENGSALPAERGVLAQAASRGEQRALDTEDDLGPWLARHWGTLRDTPFELLDQIDL